MSALAFIKEICAGMATPSPTPPPAGAHASLGAAARTASTPSVSAVAKTFSKPGVSDGSVASGALAQQHQQAPPQAFAALPGPGVHNAGEGIAGVGLGGGRATTSGDGRPRALIGTEAAQGFMASKRSKKMKRNRSGSAPPSPFTASGNIAGIGGSDGNTQVRVRVQEGSNMASSREAALTAATIATATSADAAAATDAVAGDVRAGTERGKATEEEMLQHASRASSVSAAAFDGSTPSCKILAAAAGTSAAVAGTATTMPAGHVAQHPDIGPPSQVQASGKTNGTVVVGTGAGRIALLTRSSTASEAAHLVQSSVEGTTVASTATPTIQRQLLGPDDDAPPRGAGKPHEATVPMPAPASAIFLASAAANGDSGRPRPQGHPAVKHTPPNGAVNAGPGTRVPGGMKQNAVLQTPSAPASSAFPSLASGRASSGKLLGNGTAGSDRSLSSVAGPMEEPWAESSDAGGAAQNFGGVGGGKAIAAGTAPAAAAAAAVAGGGRFSPPGGDSSGKGGDDLWLVGAGHESESVRFVIAEAARTTGEPNVTLLLDDAGVS